MLDQLTRPAVAVCAALTISALATTTADAKAPAKARLAAFERCEDLRGYARQGVLAHHAWLPVAQAYRPGEDPPRSMVLAAAGGAAEEAPDTSQTNVQEAGVDEPDIVKGRGGILFTTVGGKLRALDARGDSPIVLDQATLPNPGFGHELLLHDGRLLVLSQGFGPMADGEHRASVSLTEYDVRDARQLKRTDSYSIEGDYVAARRHGAAVRVVVTSGPETITLPAPQEGQERIPWEQLQQIGADALGRVPLSTLLPDVTERDPGSGQLERRPLTGCRSVRRPGEFSGLGVLSVVTLDLAKGIQPVDVDAVMADGEQVYASGTSLIVATTRFGRDARTVTRLHRFAAGEHPVTTYTASGAVRGRLVNQFAMSEHAGVLRVATTDGFPGAMTGGSESFVTTFKERDGELVHLGRVGGLGHGETIQAVRFLDDRAYVVTFRRIDPLYVVDLSDPAEPRLRGELKVPGFSTYLHPVDDDLVLGVGRDADEQSGWARGVQVSLFDVSDPARPVRRDVRTFSLSSGSRIAADHHAFTWWGPTRTALVPVSEYGDGGFRGVIGFRVTKAEGLVQIGRVEHEGRFASVDRSVVVGSRVLTLSANEAIFSRLSDLRRLDALTLAP